MKRIAIRADASLTIGSGHVMRCLTLADVLRERGGEIVFICRDQPGHLAAVIGERGYPVQLLSESAEAAPVADWCSHAAWLTVPWSQDAEETRQVLDGFGGCDWLIVDHYSLDRHWEARLQPVADRVMVIDDLADRTHTCDLLLDQNFYLAQQRYQGLVPEDCRLLLGPEFALLRPAFGALRQGLPERSGELKRILVFFGGVDGDNLTGRVLEALAEIPLVGIAIDVVVGAHNPHRDRIAQLCRALPEATCHCQVSNMAEMMASADLAICSGGTVTWERCCLGLPALVVAVAHNQVQTSIDTARQGGQIYLGDQARVTTQVLKAALQTLQQSPPLLASLSAQASSLVDGRGAGRVAQQLLPLGIELRAARPEDCAAIHAWRNAEETRRHIFSPDEISYADHQSWFARSLENPDRILLIGEREGAPVGVLRYDLQGTEALVSVYLVPGRQAAGSGTELLRAGSSWLRQNCPRVRRIIAEILGDNVASIRAFEKAGYTLHHLTYCQEI